ncbi:BnaC01g21530D [Brassica napus]|uniref:BnaC01g21530D protein n=1 Tax=Brassica napus TaxID=3708 RepID=A0A078HD46_BRANA|nr:BnaC01g21530D [Brassica napus]
MTPTRSNDDDKIERRHDEIERRARRRRRRDRAIITTFPDTLGRSLCSSLYESQNPASTHLLRSTMIAEYVPFSSDKRYATTQVKAPPQLQKTGAVRVSTVSHGFVYEPYALHEKILWWRRCLYVTSGSLRSLYSTQELAGVSVAVLNFLQRI